MKYWKPTFKKLFGSLFLGVALVVVGMWLGATFQSVNVMIPFLLPQWLLDQVFGVFFSAHGGSLDELMGYVIVPQWIYAYVLICLIHWASAKIKGTYV